MLIFDTNQQFATHSRRFRILCIVDDFSRECLAAVVDTSLGGVRVVRELERLTIERALPETVVSDNGTELTSRAVLCCAGQPEGSRHYIEPGKPVQNAFIESFNSKLRDECLNEYGPASGKRARSSRRGGTTTTTCARTRVSATWHRRSSRQGIKGARPSRAPLGQQSWPAQCNARRPRIQSQTVFRPPSEV